MPVLAVPTLGVTFYTAQKFLNQTVYKSFKDSAFIARKKGKNTTKIYQDVARPDLLNKIRKLDKIEKLGFLQLQALIGITKIDRLDKHSNPITIETDSHGIIRRTFQELNKLGYIENYEEKYLKDTHLVLPKLAFGNKDLGEKVQIYNMKFQKTDKKIDFDNPELRKAFPMVFGKRGILQKQGYQILSDEEGRLSINYNVKQASNNINQENLNTGAEFRQNINANISLQTQHENSINFTNSHSHGRTSDQDSREQ